jgi:alanine racemase
MSALEYNVKAIQKKIGADCQIMGVIKANAYGHGDIEIASKLEQLGLPFLAVAYVEEGIRLRQLKIKMPIVIFTGGQEPNVYEALHRYKLTPVIYHYDYLKQYNEFCRNKGKKGKVHLKFDTGMNRLGFPLEEAPEILKSLKKFKHLSFEGMMSHFANAERNSHFNKEQIHEFQELKKLSSVPFKYYHFANSGAVLNDFGINENLVRAGLTLYGAYPTLQLKSKLKLKPVMTLKSRVTQLKKVNKGDYVSYGYTHQFKKSSWIATIPVGYADGFKRCLSNKGDVLIRGKRAPVVGIICMDVFMVDVSRIPNVTLGDEVVLMGSQKKETISAEEIANKMNSIAWEVFCNISNRVARIVVK